MKLKNWIGVFLFVFACALVIADNNVELGSSLTFWIRTIGLLASVIGALLQLEPMIASDGYRVHFGRKYLTIKDFCRHNVFLENVKTKNKVKISVFRDQLCLIDIFPSTGTSEYIQKDTKPRAVSLQAGVFHVSRQRNGFRVSWSEKWREI